MYLTSTLNKLKQKIMKKIALLAFATTLSTVMFAQTTTPTPAPTTKQEDMKNLRTDIRDKRQDERQKAADIKSGNTVAAAAEKQNIKTEKQDIKTDAANAKADGVKHPIRKADRQIHRHNVIHHH